MTKQRYEIKVDEKETFSEFMAQYSDININNTPTEIIPIIKNEGIYEQAVDAITGEKVPILIDMVNGSAITLEGVFA